MPAEKLKKLIVSSVVTAVLLLFILLSIMVYQMIAIVNGRKKIDALNQKIAELEQEIEETDAEIQLWLSDWKEEERQRELGWSYPEDK